MDNYFGSAQIIRTKKCLVCCTEDHGIAIASLSDFAEVAAKVVQNPKQYENKAYSITGPELLNKTRQADIFTKVLGQEISYTNISLQDLQSTLKDFLEPWALESCMSWYQFILNGEMEVANDVKEILGKHTTFQQWVEMNQHYFEPSSNDQEGTDTVYEATENDSGEDEMENSYGGDNYDEYEEVPSLPDS